MIDKIEILAVRSYNISKVIEGSFKESREITLAISSLDLVRMWAGRIQHHFKKVNISNENNNLDITKFQKEEEKENPLDKNDENIKLIKSLLKDLEEMQNEEMVYIIEYAWQIRNSHPEDTSNIINLINFAYHAEKSLIESQMWLNQELNNMRLENHRSSMW